MNENFDATRLTLLLNELRLPATKQMWSTFAEQSDKEGWPAARLLTVLAENELAERVDLTLANLSILKTNKAKAVRFSTLEALCRELKCQPGDLLEFVREK